jgi:hypothetical protein
MAGDGPGHDHAGEQLTLTDLEAIGSHRRHVTSSAPGGRGPHARRAMFSVRPTNEGLPMAKDRWLTITTGAALVLDTRRRRDTP